jgi:tetratricopeptide (TPR) repeat protein
MTKTAICVLLAVFIFSCGIVSAQDSADYMQKAVSLMNEGKFKDAYDLLNKNYQAHKDDLQINFMLGQCAFELQKFDEAIKYYQFILSKDPSAHRVRLELARALTASGQFKEAKKEFQAVLATNPPPVVGENIKRFIEMIEAQKNWYARVSVGYLYDSNVNAGPTAKSVLMFGVPFELSKDARERSDNGEMVSASFGYLSPMTKTFAWQSEFSISHTGYFRYHEFNSEIYSMSTGPSFRNTKWVISLPVLFDYSEIGSDRYSYALGISPQIQYALSQNIILSASWTGQSKYYYTSKDRTGTAWSANGSLRFNMSQSMFIQTVYRHTEEDTRKAYLDNKSDAINISFYTGLPMGMSLYLQPSISWIKYKEKEAAYDRARDDIQYIVNANLSKDLGKGFGAALGYTYTRNDSNIAIYDYKRNQVTVQVSKAF